MVVVESDLLPADPAVVVIPLLPDYPVVKHLNPERDAITRAVDVLMSGV